MKLFALFLVLLYLSACSDSNVQTSTASIEQHYSQLVLKAADISDDGKYTLLSDNEQVCLWNNTTNNKQYPCLKGIESRLIELLGVSKNNRYFYTSNRINVHLYHLKTGQLVTVWSAGDNIINDIAMSDDETTLVFGFRNGQASVVSTLNNDITTFKPHRLDINSISISADGKKIFSGSSDKNASLWDARTGKLIANFEHKTRVNHVAMSTDAKMAFSLDAIKDRNFWLLKINKKLSELQSNIKFIEFNDAQFANNNQWLLTASPKQRLQLWEVLSGELIGEWQAKQGNKRSRSSVLSIEFISPSEIATVTSDGIYEVWPLNTQMTQD